MHVPVIMLGEDYQSGRAPAFFGADYPSNAVGSRNVSEMQTRINYYIDLGYSATGTGPTSALGMAIRDYDKQHGITTGGTVSASPTTSSGKSYKDILDSITPAVKSGFENMPAIINAIRNKNPGMSEAEAANVANYGKKQSMVGANMPWLILGGVGLVAVLFLIGTRKR